MAGGKHARVPYASGHFERGRIPVFTVMHERAVVRRFGEDFGLREDWVYLGAQKPPVSPNTPRKSKSYGIHVRGDADGIDETASLRGAPNRARRYADVRDPSTTFQVRTPTGAAARDRGGGQTLTFGQPPRWSGPGAIREPSNRT